MDKRISKLNLENTALAVMCSAVIVFMLCWLSSRFMTLDDLTYRDIFREYTLHTFVGRYHEWSQRFLIEYPIFSILRIDSYYLPKLITGILYLAYFFTLCSIVRCFITVDRRIYLIICLLVFLQSQLELEGAGYLTSHLNYLAPLVTVLYSFKLLLTQLYGLKAILFFLFFLFSTNNELVAAGVLPFLIYFYFKVPNENRSVTVVALVIALCNLLLFFCSGATTIRVCMHQAWVFPTFEDFGLFYKLYLGSLTTLLYYFANFNPFTVMFLTTLIYAYFKSSGRELNVFQCALLAVALCVLLYVLAYFNKDLNKSILDYVQADYVDFTSPIKISLFIFSLVVCFLIVYLIYKLKGNGINKTFKFNVYALLAFAFAIRAIMGFSPTILFSQGRTFIFSNALLLLCAMYISYKFDLYKLKQFTVMAIVCAVVCLTSRSLFLLSDEALDYPYYPKLINNWDKYEDYCYLKYDLKDHSLMSKDLLEQRKKEYPFDDLIATVNLRKNLLKNKVEIPAPVFNIQISQGHSSLNRDIEKKRITYQDWLEEQVKTGKIILKVRHYEIIKDDKGIPMRKPSSDIPVVNHNSFIR